MEADESSQEGHADPSLLRLLAYARLHSPAFNSSAFHSFAALFSAKAKGIMADKILLGIVRFMAIALQGSQAATQVTRGSTPNVMTATEGLA